jgi:hypothetical protein
MAKDRYKWAQRFTHRLGNQSAEHISLFLDDLFSTPGDKGIKRALQMAHSISDQDLKHRIIQAIVRWAGNAANEDDARKLVTGYAYVSAILAFDKAVLSQVALAKSVARQLLKLRSNQKQLQLQQIKPLIERFPESRSKSLPREIQVLLISNAPAIAPNLSSNHSL